jgi:hypothetical protein
MTVPTALGGEAGEAMRRDLLLPGRLVAIESLMFVLRPSSDFVHSVHTLFIPSGCDTICLFHSQLTDEDHANIKILRS